LSDDAGRRARFLDRIDSVLTPFLQSKKLDWEYSIVDGIREEWRINGLAPPPPDSEGEKLWAAEGRPLPYEDSQDLKEGSN